jgi:hypothetical protein
MFAEVKAEWGKTMAQYCDQALPKFMTFEYELNPEYFEGKTLSSQSSFLTHASTKAQAFL